ncbi:MAG: MerR family transcriptional regulator [Clostridia bacterium]|nr:MerR family transcriptional regulator [Clostridia bacterium]
MKIKEIEERTGITRANIRFYESKGLLHPERQGNNYRDYSQEDIETLRKVILFRRLGISIENIQALFQGELSLQDAVGKAKLDLQEQMEQLQGSLELCTVMQEREETLDTLSVDIYDELIRQREQEGKKFRDMMGDILEDYQKNYLEKWAIFPIHGSYVKGGAVALGICYLINWLLYTFYILPENGLWGGLKTAFMMLEAFVIVSAGYSCTDCSAGCFRVHAKKEKERLCLLPVQCLHLSSS